MPQSGIEPGTSDCQVISVNKLGEILDILLGVYLVFDTIMNLLWQLFCNWAHFNYCKLPNIEQKF